MPECLNCGDLGVITGENLLQDWRTYLGREQNCCSFLLNKCYSEKAQITGFQWLIAYAVFEVE